MGDVKRGAKRGWNSVRKLTNDAIEGSKQIGEKLGYGAVVVSDKTQKMLNPPAPPVMPDPDDEELRKARRKRLASASRSGRASTILSSNDDDTLG